MKKILALILALLMVVAMGAAACAEPAATDYQIKIDNAVVGETYRAYKVFDVTYSNPVDPAPTVTPVTDIPGAPDETSFHSAYSYTISTSSPFWTDLTTGVTADTNGVYSLTAYGLKFVPTTTEGVYNVLPIADSGVTAAQAQTLAAFLATKLDGKNPAASGTAEATTNVNNHGNYKTDELILNVGLSGPGYYFVDTTTGSLCSLDTTERIATIREKNSIPTEDKKVSNTADGTGSDATNVKIGDTVYFTIEVTDSKGTDKSVTVHDKMDNALTLDLNSFAVKVDGAAVDAANYKIKYNSTAVVKNATEADSKVISATLADGCTFEIEFTDAYIQSLAEGKKIVITYEAELNENAVTVDPFQVNKTHLEYSEQNTVEKEVTVKTYQVDVVKTDDQNKLLDGATFNLYDAATDGNKFNLVKIEDGKYRIAVSTDASTDYAEKLVPKDGKLTIVGLENGTYYLEEVDHPAGYNPLTERKSFTINNDNNSATIDGTTYTEGGVQVINKSGTELPSTGGIGTTLFYVVGGLLVAGAVVVLVSRKRME